jgi:acetyl/propionyl-CoA carboxylase alpha subunit
MLKRASSSLKKLTSAFLPKNALSRPVSTLIGTGTGHISKSADLPKYQNTSNLLQRALSSTPVVMPAQSSMHQTSYVSPYDVSEPLNYIIIHNRSKNAANYATRKLKQAWPNLKIIHVVQDDRDPIPGSDLTVRIKDWSSMSHFKTQFDNVAAQNPALRASMRDGSVGFYCVWSAAAESSEWAREAQAAGFHWIGASPDKMEGLDKIAYKELCLSKGLPTADFIEIKAPEKSADREEAFQLMAKNLVERYHQTPALAGSPVFLKHEAGGGGRGTKKVSEMTSDNALEAIRKIVNETGGSLDGVYAEQALDLEGAQMYQIEIEGDASQLSDGARLVWFNKDNQKVLEVGFTDKAILEILPQGVYEACRAASKIIFEASGYDSRGTNEILIVKDKHGDWSFKLLELNKRIQVENEAISELVHDKNGHTRNVSAEQVMRSMGYPAPSASDFSDHGAAIVAHVRLLSCEITNTGSLYPSGLEIDGAVYPQGADVQFAKGPVFLDADPQIGRALIKAQTWEDFCDKLLNFSQNFQFYGAKTELSTYFNFMRQLASDPLFRQGQLGCNQTFNVLFNPPVEAGRIQKIVAALSHTVTPLVSNGYRPNDGVKDQPYPTRNQMQEFVRFMEDLQYEAIPETPFSRFLEHHDFKHYIQDLKDLLANHGGGTVTVIRDVQQASADQESALIQKASAKIAEIYFAGAGIGVGFETGGAQYQAALMRNFDWMEVLLAGCRSNLASHSLTRSKWLNGLLAKSPEKQAFIFKTIADEIAKHYGLSASQSFLPWLPYNFHAGNHPEQDLTTRAMLQANLGVIPNWAWDPRYTQDHFKGWVKRQIDLFEVEGKPLSQIRIKNPGQGPDWNANVIVNLVQTIRGMFKERGLDEPIIFIHNHEFNGMAAHIAAEAIKQCQQLGYSFLIVDSAPPGTSHNSNLIISESFVMSAEQRAYLKHYNQGAWLALDLTTRFNNSNLTKKIQNPDSKMAGGTNSSDLVDAIKMDIHPHDMDKAIALGYELTGLGTPVTPYSEWIKQIGFAIWNTKEITPKTVEAVEDYINQGGQLTIATPILDGLRDWKTLLPRPQIVEKLLTNHGISLEIEEAGSRPEAALDIAAERASLQKQLPNTRITDRVLSTAFGFDNIGLENLKSRDKQELDMTVMMESPEFVYSEVKQAGDSFQLSGEKITINHVERNLKTGDVDVSYSFQGQTIRMQGEDLRIENNAPKSSVKYAKDNNDQEVGAPMPGKLIRFFVQPGDAVKKGQHLATIEAMKMENTLRADKDGEVESIKDLDERASMVERGELLVTFKPS